MIAGCASMLVGCAPVQPITYQPMAARVAPANAPSSVIVLNRTAPRPRDPMRRDLPDPPALSDVIKSDLERYFSDSNTGKGNTILRITIREADQYYVLTPADHVAFASFVSAFLEKEMVAHTSILLEVETNGHVERSYVLEHESTTRNLVSTNEQAREGQTRLVEQFRNGLIEKLDSDFVSRYLY